MRAQNTMMKSGGSIAIFLVFVLSSAIASGCAFIRDFDEFSFSAVDGSVDDKGTDPGRGDGGDDPEECVPSAEVCNSIDDDCNGLIDDEPEPCEHPFASESACVAGECKIVTCLVETGCGPITTQWAAFITGIPVNAELRLAHVGDAAIVVVPFGATHTVHNADGTSVTVDASDPSHQTNIAVYRLSADGIFSAPLIIEATSGFSVNGITAAATGHSYLVGRFSSEPASPPGLFDAAPVGSDGFLLSLTPDLTIRDTKRFGGAGTQDAMTVELTPAGNIVVGGRFNTSALVYMGVNRAGGAALGSFIMTINQSFTALSTRILPGSGAFYQMHLASTASGDIYVGGAIEGELSIGSETHEGENMLLAARLNSALAPVWSTLFTDTAEFGADEAIYLMAGDINGELIVSGGVVDAVDLGGGPLDASGPYLGRLSGSEGGAHRWSRTVVDTLFTDLQVGRDGNIYLTGSIGGFGLPDLGGGPIELAGGRDAVFVSYDLDGNYRWLKSFGAVEDEGGIALTAHDSGEVTAIGSYAQDLSLDGIEAPAGGGYFVIRLAL